MSRHLLHRELGRRDAEIQEIDETLAPLMAAHHDAIQLDSALYWRIKTLHDQLDDLDLNPEQRLSRRAPLPRDDARRCGARRRREGAADRPEPAALALTTTFEKNLLADTNDLAVVFDDAAELDGLTEGELSAAAQTAPIEGSRASTSSR